MFRLEFVCVVFIAVDSFFDSAIEWQIVSNGSLMRGYEYEYEYEYE
jgi:hypothetical protein